jgi:phage terminase large subunit
MDKKFQGGRTKRTYAPRVGKTREDKKYKYVDVFEPLPWSIPALNSKAPILLLTGSAGGGKSMAAAQKIHAFLLAYPGATALVVRKTQTSMFNSTVAFLKKKIMGRYLNNGMINHKSTEKRFEYANGSTLIYGGMASDEQKEAIRSVGPEGGVDIAWMEEATQFEEGDFDEVRGRMRGNKAGWRQVILSTNPDAPTHWIYQRLILGGEAEVHYSKASDNYHNPNDYQDSLDGMRGVERDRLRDGKWTQAGGLVIDSWLDDYDNVEGVSRGSVTVEADYIPDGGPVYWWVDDGYTGEKDKVSGAFKAGSHPRVFLFAQIRPDGTIAVFYESYKIKTLAPAHIQEVVAISTAMNWPVPSRVVYDKAAASLGGHLREELFKVWRLPASYVTYNAVPVDQGNNELNTWVAPDGNTVRRLRAHPRCKNLRLEMVTYKINPKTGRVVKDFDHGPDACRIGLWDYVYGGPAEVDVASLDDVTPLPLDGLHEAHLEEGIENYHMGDVSVAAVI